MDAGAGTCGECENLKTRRGWKSVEQRRSVPRVQGRPRRDKGWNGARARVACSPSRSIALPVCAAWLASPVRVCLPVDATPGGRKMCRHPDETDEAPPPK